MLVYNSSVYGSGGPINKKGGYHVKCYRRSRNATHGAGKL